MTRSAAPFDAGALDQLFAIDGTGEVLEELALLFLRDMSASVASLLRAVGDGDLSHVHRAAHTIKGCAPTFGAVDLGWVAARIVDDALDARLPHTADLEALDPALTLAGEALLTAVAQKRAGRVPTTVKGST